jgi:hypothetical protein
MPMHIKFDRFYSAISILELFAYIIYLFIYSLWLATWRMSLGD